MSILTKVLAVLLSVFSLLMAGMFVVFVGNTNNYKNLYEDQKQLTATLQGDLIVKDEQCNLQVKKIDELKKENSQELQDLRADKNQLESKLRETQRSAQQYEAQADRWKGVMTGFEQGIRNLQASLKETQTQLDTARSEGIKSQKELNQITADLYEKIVQLESLEAERRRLLEKNEELENRIMTGSSPVRETRPVTPQPHRSATSTVVAPAGTDVKGLVVEVEQNLITLSVGSADGVKEDMVFHITRGDRFLCDVIVTNVDINRSAGVLDLVQQHPQVGDTASTQL